MLVLLLASAEFFWLFNFSTLPLSNPELIKLSGREGLLDVMPYYSAQEAFSALSHYGAAGRALYLRFLAADFIFIFVYSFGFALLLTRALRSLGTNNNSWFLLNLLPFCIGFFDFIENVSILTMLILFPNTSSAIGTLSGVATLCKNILTVCTLFTVTSVCLILLMRRLGFKSLRIML
jgi:hypothetical protein